MPKKYYAVKVGKTTGIFETWEECKNSVNGYPNAEYKSFTEREKAENYLNNTDEKKTVLDEAKRKNILIAYIDGSFSTEIGKYSYGIVAIMPSGGIYETYGVGDDKKAVASRNVAGEVKGVMHLIGYVNKNLFKSVIIRYDYEGIEKWFTREWKAKTYVAKEYVKFMNINSKGLKLIFEKIKSHSNDKYNDRVDKLAKKALLQETNIKQVKKEGEDYIVIKGVKDVDEIKVIVETMKEEYCINYDIKESVDKCIFILTFGKDKITVTFFNNKNNLMIQGHKNNVYSIFINYLGTLVDSLKLIPVLNKYYNLSIEQEQIDNQFILYLPNANKDLIEEKRKTVLSQSIFNLSVGGQMYDYACLAFPVLRVTEAYIKDIRDRIAKSIEPHNLFEKSDNNVFKLKECYKKKIGNKEKISHFNKLYNYYCQERHRLFHWDDLETNLDTTKIIKDCTEAHNIIKVGLINEFYGLYK